MKKIFYGDCLDEPKIEQEKNYDKNILKSQVAIFNAKRGNNAEPLRKTMNQRSEDLANARLFELKRDVEKARLTKILENLEGYKELESWKEI